MYSGCGKAMEPNLQDENAALREEIDALNLDISLIRDDYLELIRDVHELRDKLAEANARINKSIDNALFLQGYVGTKLQWLIQDLKGEE